MICQCFMRIFLRFGVAGLLVVTNSKIYFVLFVLLRRASVLTVGEMNFSQDFMDKSSRIASVTESLLKVSFVLSIKILLDWVGS